MEDNPTIIGKGLSSLTWVVDPEDHNRLMPIGCVGELLIQGPLLARGYLNDPDKSAAGFIWNPGFCTTPSRMYKTGDLVCHNPDGTLVYLGGKDRQVKINGQRVELSDIEYHVQSNLAIATQVAVDLAPLPSVYSRQAVVAFFTLDNVSDLANLDGPEDSFLAVSGILSSRLYALEAKPSDHLPGYMVPSMYIPVRELPRSVAGKLDKKALRARLIRLSEGQIACYGLSADTSVARTPASTETELRLRSLWHSTLHFVPGASIFLRDNFFRFGSGSLTAIQLSVAASQQGLALTVAEIFHAPTLKGMASYMTLLSPREDEDHAQWTKPFSLIAEYPASKPLQDAAAHCHITVDSIVDI